MKSGQLGGERGGINRQPVSANCPNVYLPRVIANGRQFFEHAAALHYLCAVVANLRQQPQMFCHPMSADLPLARDRLD
jgi:hypothetical protein